MKKVILVVCLLVCSVFFFGTTWAIEFPNKPINVIQAYGVGGSTDMLMRGISPYLSKELNTRIVIQNVPGAGGVLGYNKAFKAPPDGYNLLISNFPTVYAVELISQNSAFRTKEFMPIYAFAKDNVILVVHQDTFTTFDDFVKSAQSRPLRMGGTGQGTPTVLAGLILEKALKVKFNFIPYQSGAECVTALAGNHIDAVVTYSSSAAALIRAKRIKPLLFFSEERTAAYPQIPTLRELGYDTPGVYSIYGFFAPPHTPQDRLMVLEAACDRAVKTPAFIDWMKRGTAEYINLNTKEFKTDFGKLMSLVDGLKELIK
jgi:tripartite-type tricarboxylate transporter receptor subunit TctC